jgi:hypothetical protein
MRILGIMLLTLVGAGACVADVTGTHQESKQEEAPAGGGGQNSDDTTTTPTGYLKQIAEIYCGESFTCRAEFPTDRGYPFEAQWGSSNEECVQRLLTSWDPAAIETEIAKGRAMYDGAAGITCLEGVTFGTCADYWASGIHWAESCYHVIIGLIPAGGACDNLYACSSQSCDVASHTCL